MYVTEIKVRGDKDSTYTITIVDEQATCSCPAFTFHPEKPCKHMRYVTELLSAAVLLAPA